MEVTYIAKSYKPDLPVTRYVHVCGKCRDKHEQKNPQHPVMRVS